MTKKFIHEGSSSIIALCGEYNSSSIRPSTGPSISFVTIGIVSLSGDGPFFFRYWQPLKSSGETNLWRHMLLQFDLCVMVISVYYLRGAELN